MDKSFFQLLLKGTKGNHIRVIKVAKKCWTLTWLEDLFCHSYRIFSSTRACKALFRSLHTCNGCLYKWKCFYSLTVVMSRDIVVMEIRCGVYAKDKLWRSSFWNTKNSAIELCNDLKWCSSIHYRTFYVEDILFLLFNKTCLLNGINEE